MIERVALFVGSLASALVLAGALALAGLNPVANAGSPPPTASVTVTQAADPAVQVDTVYLTQPAARQIVVHQNVAGQHGDDEAGEDD